MQQIMVILDTQMARSPGKSAHQGKPHIGFGETQDASRWIAVPKASDCGWLSRLAANLRISLHRALPENSVTQDAMRPVVQTAFEGRRALVSAAVQHAPKSQRATPFTIREHSAACPRPSNPKARCFQRELRESQGMGVVIDNWFGCVLHSILQVQPSR